MRVSTIAAAAVAVVAISGVALAEGVIKGKPTSPVVMTDAELDAVVAGVPALIVHGVGNGTTPPNGNVILGGNNASGAPEPSGLLNPHAFSGTSLNAAKPCKLC